METNSVEVLLNWLKVKPGHSVGAPSYQCRHRLTYREPGRAGQVCRGDRSGAS